MKDIFYELNKSKTITNNRNKLAVYHRLLEPVCNTFSGLEGEFEGNTISR